MNDEHDKNNASQKPRLISFVLPVCDEKDSLRELYDKITAAMDTLPDRHELWFIDDGSADGSIDILKTLHEQDSRVKIIQFRRNFGKAAAYMAGFEKSEGDIIVTMDADLQDDPAELPLFLEKIDEGFDLANGWKYEGKGPVSKTIPSRIFNKVVSWVTRIPLHDFNCPFKVYKREVLDEIEVYGELHRYIPVIAHTRGFSIAEVKISNLPRKHGVSKYGLERYLRGLFDLMTVIFITRFSKRPLHLLGISGVLATLFGAGILSFLIGAHFLYVLGIVTHPSWNIHDRPAISLGILLMIVGIQFFSIGLIGELIVSGRHSTQYNGGYSIKRIIKS